MNVLTLNEEMLLVVILSLGDRAYGVSIMEKIQKISDKTIVFGTLYNSLGHLANKGYATATPGDPTPERGGKSKVFYKLTRKGLAALRETREFHLALWTWIPESASNL
jgi:PadR family transcriptional regulator PadR